MRLPQSLREEEVRALLRKSCMPAVTRILARMPDFSTLMLMILRRMLIGIMALAFAVDWNGFRYPVAGRYVSGEYVDPITLGSLGEQRGEQQQLFGFLL